MTHFLIEMNEINDCMILLTKHLYTVNSLLTSKEIKKIVRINESSSYPG